MELVTLLITVFFRQIQLSDMQSQISFLAVTHNPAARTKNRTAYLGFPGASIAGIPN
jgi:hypothetical protein